jgi:hypothetical protein
MSLFGYPSQEKAVQRQIDVLDAEIDQIIKELRNTSANNQTDTNDTVQTLSDNLDAEITNRTNSDITINEAIDTEEIDRKAAITSLDSKIVGVNSASISADSTLQSNINTVSTNLTTEKNNRVDADNTLTNNLATTNTNLANEAETRRVAINTANSNIAVTNNTLSIVVNKITALRTASTTANESVNTFFRSGDTVAVDTLISIAPFSNNSYLKLGGTRLNALNYIESFSDDLHIRTITNGKKVFIQDSVATTPFAISDRFNTIESSTTTGITALQNKTAILSQKQDSVSITSTFQSNDSSRSNTFLEVARQDGTAYTRLSSLATTGLNVLDSFGNDLLITTNTDGKKILCQDKGGVRYGLTERFTDIESLNGTQNTNLTNLKTKTDMISYVFVDNSGVGSIRNHDIVNIRSLADAHDTILRLTSKTSGKSLSFTCRGDNVPNNLIESTGSDLYIQSGTSDIRISDQASGYSSYKVSTRFNNLDSDITQLYSRSNTATSGISTNTTNISNISNINGNIPINNAVRELVFLKDRWIMSFAQKSGNQYLFSTTSANYIDIFDDFNLVYNFSNGSATKLNYSTANKGSISITPSPTGSQRVFLKVSFECDLSMFSNNTGQYLATDVLLNCFTRDPRNNASTMTKQIQATNCTLSSIQTASNTYLPEKKRVSFTTILETGIIPNSTTSDIFSIGIRNGGGSFPARGVMMSDATLIVELLGGFNP